MADRLGRNIRVNIGIEDSYGTGQATPKTYALGRSSLNINPVQTITNTPEIRPDPNPAQPIRDILDLSGQLALVTSVDSLPLLLNLMTGNSAMSLTVAPFMWTTKIQANALKSAVVERYDSVETKSDLTKGVIVSGMKFSWRKKGGPLITTWTVNGIGAAIVRNNGSQFDSAPTVMSAARHSMRDCTLTIDGATTLASYVVGFDLAFQFGVERKDALTGNAFADAMIPGTCVITASMLASRPTADGIYGICDGADHIFVFTSPQPSAPTRFMRITMNQVRVEKTNPTDESAPGMESEPFTLLPYYTSNADNTSVKFEIANDKGTAY